MIFANDNGGEWLLSKDVGERNDLAVAHPALVADLRRRIQEWEKDVDAEAKQLQVQQSR